MTDTVHAYPRKQFFIEMFTRDLRLEDCILDLIDNSMDALLTSRGINVERFILGQQNGPKKERHPKATIQLNLSESRVSITDDCGGMSYGDAVTEAFCFGHGDEAPKKRLGVYGIGLKRAIFKIGNRVRIDSRTESDSFEVEISDVKEWAKKDAKIEDWTFPIRRLQNGASLKERGMSVVITELHDEVKARLNDGTIASILDRSVAQSYPFFLDSLVDVRIGKNAVRGVPLPFGGSDKIEPGIAKFEQGGVKATILATVAPGDKWTQEYAGWYVICNGRVVVNANKDDLTGWGQTLPAFHSKYRGFVGLALFTSEDPAKLPWTTSKRGLNREALVFQRARNVMAGAAKPVISFLNDMYPSELAEHPPERQAAKEVIQRDFAPLLSLEPVAFTRKLATTTKKTVRIQFDARTSDIEKIKKKLRRPHMSASDIGRHALEYYLTNECAE